MSMDRDYAASLGDLLQCLTTLKVKKSLLMFKGNFLISICAHCLSCAHLLGVHYPISKILILIVLTFIIDPWDTPLASGLHRLC